MRTLERLFKPKSIAVVGASPNKSEVGYQILYSLKDFPGRLYPINPKADNIFGFKTYPSLNAIGEPIDLVILTTPAAACVNVLKDAGELNAGAALITSGGFAETGGDVGQKLQRKILSVCRKYNIRLLGPNTAGFLNPCSKTFPNSSPWTTEIPAGHIGIVSQSGAICMVLSSMVHSQNLGVSLAVGTGNDADVNIEAAVEYLANDPQTKVIILCLEGVRCGRRLYNVITRTTEKKPVIVFPLGKGDIGEFAESHTGNLIGSYKIKTAALKQAGAVIVQSNDDLIDAANLLSRVRLPPKRNPGVGILTGEAGPGMVIADYLRSRGILIPELHPVTVDKISRALPPLTFIRNPVDTSRPGRTFPDIMRAIALDTSIDLLAVFVLWDSSAIGPVALLRDASDIRTPIILGTAGIKNEIDETIKSLSELNIAAFSSPDRAARAIHALVEDAKAAWRKTRFMCQKIPTIAVGPLTHDPDEDEAKNILDQIGIPTPRRMACLSHEEAMTAFHSMNRPVSAQIIHSSIGHKTEVGGIICGIDTERFLTEALKSIDSIITGDSPGYLIEEMSGNGLDITICARNDPSFGPAVMVSLDGIIAEAMDDVTVRMAPLCINEAMEMIMELKGNSLFEGRLCSGTLDINSLAETIVLVGQLMTTCPKIKQVDLNPVRVYPKGVMALDAHIVIDNKGEESASSSCL